MSSTSLRSAAQLIQIAQQQYQIVGRERELATIHWAVAAGRHLLIEGPVGVGKTVLAQAVAAAHGRQLVRVDGDSRFTEQKLTGGFDPSRVLREGYSVESFQAGPLVKAMQEGAILFVNELNRMPESVQNIFLPVLDEGKLLVPNLGWVEAQPGFLVIATQNPREFVATSHLSEALLDRMEWIALTPQLLNEEVEIVTRDLRRRGGKLSRTWIELSVEAVRATRHHPQLKRGASIRAALSLVALLEARVQELTSDGAPNLSDEDWVTAAQLALATRVEFLASVASGEQFEKKLEALVRSLLSEVKKNS